MPWSKSYLPKETAADRVMEFVPQKIDLGTPAQAIEYLRLKAQSDFRMNPAIEVQTGVDKIEKISEDEKVEQRALSMLAEVQEAAYKEAYQLGLDEGAKKAYQDLSSRIETGMQALAELTGSLERIKAELVQQNEAHLIKLVYHMASRLAVTQIQQAPDSILPVLRQATILAQGEEDVRIQVNPSQIEFLEEIKGRSGRDFEFLKNARFEPNDKVRHGGCIVETNYGEVDSRIEQRLETLWNAVLESVPRVKNQVTD